jgi:hypothetical protein
MSSTTTATESASSSSAIPSSSSSSETWRGATPEIIDVPARERQIDRLIVLSNDEIHIELSKLTVPELREIKTVLASYSVTSEAVNDHKRHLSPGLRPSNKVPDDIHPAVKVYWWTDIIICSRMEVMQVSIEVGGNILDTMYESWLDVWNKLTSQSTPAPEQRSMVAAEAPGWRNRKTRDRLRSIIAKRRAETFHQQHLEHQRRI